MHFTGGSAPPACPVGGHPTEAGHGEGWHTPSPRAPSPHAGAHECEPPLCCKIQRCLGEEA
eukprot:1157438-Pelagomonas_calceolata.AAC.3